VRPARLVKMANEVAHFYEVQLEPAAAAEAVASHLRRFWSPSMRRDLVSYVLASDGAGLNAIVLEAIIAPSFD